MLDRIRIFAAQQNILFVIGFDNQNVRVTDCRKDLLRHAAGICNERDLAIALLEGIADRLCRVMRDTKNVHLNIPDKKTVAASHDFKLFSLRLRILLRYGFTGPARGEYRAAIRLFGKQRADALDMIDMLMGQHDAVQLRARKSAGRKAFLCFFRADADIRQNSRALTLYQKTVPRAAAGEGTNR